MLMSQLIIWLLELQIKQNNPNIKPTNELAAVIYKQSIKHKVNPRLLSAILMQESSYIVQKVSKSGHDFGIGQIHFSSIRAYGFNKTKLLSDLNYSVGASAKELGYMKRQYYKTDGDNYFVRYNCGTRKNINRTTCNKYKKAVYKYY